VITDADIAHWRSRVDELFDEVLLVAQRGARVDGSFGGGADLPVVAVSLRVAILLDEHQHLVDVDLDLLDELDLEHDDVVVDRTPSRRRPSPPLVHRRAYVNGSNELVGVDDGGNSLAPVTPQEQEALARAAQLAAELVTSCLPDGRTHADLERQLGHLSRLHSATLSPVTLAEVPSE
jgi:hypothetical protein